MHSRAWYSNALEGTSAWSGSTFKWTSKRNPVFKDTSQRGETNIRSTPCNRIQRWYASNAFEHLKQQTGALFFPSRVQGVQWDFCSRILVVCANWSNAIATSVDAKPFHVCIFALRCWYDCPRPRWFCRSWQFVFQGTGQGVSSWGILSLASAKHVSLVISNWIHGHDRPTSSNNDSRKPYQILSGCPIFIDVSFSFVSFKAFAFNKEAFKEIHVWNKFKGISRLPLQGFS